MTPTTIATDAARSTDVRVIALVGAAHFVSHIYILVLPPLFPFVRADFGVSYTELGIAIALFNILTGLLQTPAGFLVDRFSARAVLIGGLLLGAASLAGAALVSSFYYFRRDVRALRHCERGLPPGRLCAALRPRVGGAHEPGLFDPYLRGLCRDRRGAGDPADSGRKSRMARRLSRSRSPRRRWSRPLVLLFGDVMAGRDPARIREKETGEKGADSRILFSAPILLSLCFYMLLAMAAGLQIYGIVALASVVGHIAFARDHGASPPISP